MFILIYFIFIFLSTTYIIFVICYRLDLHHPGQRQLQICRPGIPKSFLIIIMGELLYLALVLVLWRRPQWWWWWCIIIIVVVVVIITSLLD